MLFERQRKFDFQIPRRSGLWDLSDKQRRTKTFFFFLSRELKNADGSRLSLGLVVHDPMAPVTPGHHTYRQSMTTCILIK